MAGECGIHLPHPECVSCCCEWQEDRNSILSFKTPELGDFIGVGKKDLYITCVKVLHAEGLAVMRATKWAEFFGSDPPPKCRRSLY